MANLSISKFSFEKSKVEKHKNGHISLSLAQNKKKTTLFSQTFKVEEKKVILSLAEIAAL